MTELRELSYFKLEPTAKAPVLGTSESVGWDVHAFCISESGRPLNRLIPRYNTVAIPTGIVVRPPPGFYIQVCSRSGMAMKSLFVTNSPGIIDPDYTGELKILLYNGHFEAQYVQHEQRIAQLIIAPVVRAQIKEIFNLPKTGRGERGFGSTGE